MLNNNSKSCIFILGLLACTDKEHLSKFGIGRKTLANLIQKKLIQKETLLISNKAYKVYSLTNKGIREFKIIYKDYCIGRSRSRIHDYIHSKVVLDYANTIEELYSYKNEKDIREEYRDKIAKCEIENNIKISCPDCFLVVGGKGVFIETLIKANKINQEKKRNFKLVIEDNTELIIYKF